MKSLAELPNEIQSQIIRLCLHGWHAALELHTKPRNDNPDKLKSTLRLWSSKIHDALMLSLTCKNFHAIVQDVQKDPALFDGRIDLVQEPGALIYFSDALYERFPDFDFDHFVPKHDERPADIMYKTQIFIKSSPYGSGTKDKRAQARKKYHADVRAWLIAHVCRLEVLFDEVHSDFDRALFPRLRDLMMYWADGQTAQPNDWEFEDSDAFVPLCDRSFGEQLTTHELYDLIDPYSDSDYNGLDQLVEQGLNLTFIYDVEHYHSDDPEGFPHLRLEYGVDRKAPKLKSLACLQKYARPGQDVAMKKIEMKKDKVDN